MTDPVRVLTDRAGGLRPEPATQSQPEALIPRAGAPHRRVWPLGGYAPGGYIGKCRDCGDKHLAAKHSYQCLDCAVISANARIADIDASMNHAATVEMRLRIALRNELRRNGVTDDVAIKLIREAVESDG